MNFDSAPSKSRNIGPPPARIQIVEDERIVALDLKETIESFGYTVTGMAARGDTAVDMAARHRPDLVLMDINLEGEMSGTEAALRIRDQHRIPVIFLTAYAGDADLERAQASAPYGYLLKPFETRELRAILAMALARRGAERETERSEERLGLALEAGSMVAWEWDEGGRKSWISNHAPESCEYAPRLISMGQEALLEVTHPEDREALERALRNAESIDTQIRLLVEPPDDYRWMQMHARTFAAPAPAQSRVIGVAQDVTERRALHERLRSTEAAMSATGDGIVILNADRNILSVNSSFVRLTGYVAGEVVGRNPDDFLHARRHSDQFYPLAKDMKGGFWRGEIACRRKSGEIFPAIQTISAVTNDAAVVTNFVLSFSDISALRRREARISHMVLHDALTGLGNRRLLQQRLHLEVANAQRLHSALSFFFIDLDGFKTINDSVGHDIGDAMLRTIATRIEENIRRSDLAIRIGGDEFLVILRSDGEEESARVAQKLLEAISAQADLQGEHLSVSCSIGIAMFPAHGSDGNELIKAADSAMYEAKRNGRNRYAFYTQDLSQKAHTRLLIEQGLRQALARGEFTLQYQPIVDLRGFQILGYESLARWIHPTAGPISPAQFIPVAEESGLIDQFGDHVLRRACTEWQPHLDGLAGDLRVAVNVSVRQFLGPDFTARVRAILEDTGFPARRLELEITESALQGIESARYYLEPLKEMGITVAVDDFGTGYSSLSLLNRLPIDTIKIDRSFVAALSSDAATEAITRAVLMMSESLDLNVVAEGIETLPQLQKLHSLGCPRGQGYYFSRPVDPETAFRQAGRETIRPQ